MADKEATVYIIDVGRSMGKKHNNRDQTDLEWALLYIWDKITSIMALERKTTLQGVVGVKTDKTDNELAPTDDSYEHITVYQELGQVQLPDLQNLQKIIVPNKTGQGDAISAVCVAVMMIAKTCKKLKYKRKIILVTSGHGELDTELLSDIADKIKEDQIELVILGVDFDDPEFGFKEEDKDPEKESFIGCAENEKLLKTFAEDCEGTFGTLKEAIEELGTPRTKTTRPVASFKGQLMLGDPENKYGNTMFIDVERYPRTSIRKPPTASSYVRHTGEAQSSTAMGSDMLEDATTGDALASMKTNRTYQVDDPEAPGGKREVQFDELAKGYEYGSTAVPISDSDWSVLKIETKAGLEIIGFIDSDQFPRQMEMSETSVILPARGNTKAAMALSSFVRALFEQRSYAVARLVRKDNLGPVIVLLTPSFEPDCECLIDVQLPFEEDVRNYRFAPLDRIVTVSGKEVKEHRKLPNDALKKAMSDYVDSMDMSHLGVDDQGNPEYARMEDMYSPILHRIQQVIRWRASNPTGDIPPPPAVLIKYSKPPLELIERSEKQLERLKQVAHIEKVPPKANSRKRKSEGPAPISGLDVNRLLKKEFQNKRVHISPENPIPDFENFLEFCEEPGHIKGAATQLGTIIESRVRESQGGYRYGQALKEMSVFKDGMDNVEEYGLWNDWAREFKRKVQAGELNGDQTEFWYEVRAYRYGDKGEKNLSLLEGEKKKGGVKNEEAREFLGPKRRE